MAAKSPTIIGINLGTRYTGIAVLIGNELRDWRVKVINGKILTDKFRCLSAILTQLLSIYTPSVVALKKPHPSKSSPALDRLQAEAKTFLEQRGIGLLEYSLDEVKLWILPNQTANRSRLADFLVTQYPILAEEWRREKVLRRAYRMAMFNAVAVARIAANPTAVAA